jgi:hypothetical protein
MINEMDLIPFLLLAVVYVPIITLMLAPPLLVVVSCYTHWCTRGRSYPNRASAFLEYTATRLGVCRKDPSKYHWSSECDHGAFYWMGYVLFGGMLLIVWAGVVSHTDSMVILMILGGMFTLALPRYLGDIFHSLKYCFKSNESIRLKELEERLADLEK